MTDVHNPQLNAGISHKKQDNFDEHSVNQLYIYAAWDMYTRGRHADCPAFSSKIAPPPIKKIKLLIGWIPLPNNLQVLGGKFNIQIVYVYHSSSLSCLVSHLIWMNEGTEILDWNTGIFFEVLKEHHFLKIYQKL